METLDVPTLKKRLVVSISFAVGLVVASVVIPDTRWTDWLNTVVLLPGLLVASVHWPEGAHTRADPTGKSVMLMFAVMYIVSSVFWTGVVLVWFAWRHQRNTHDDQEGVSH